MNIQYLVLAKKMQASAKGAAGALWLSGRKPQRSRANATPHSNWPCCFLTHFSIDYDLTSSILLAHAYLASHERLAVPPALSYGARLRGGVEFANSRDDAERSRIIAWQGARKGVGELHSSMSLFMLPLKALQGSPCSRRSLLLKASRFNAGHGNAPGTTPGR